MVGIHREQRAAVVKDHAGPRNDEPGAETVEQTADHRCAVAVFVGNGNVRSVPRRTQRHERHRNDGASGIDTRPDVRDPVRVETCEGRLATVIRTHRGERIAKSELRRFDDEVRPLGSADDSERVESVENRGSDECGDPLAVRRAFQQLDVPVAGRDRIGPFAPVFPQVIVGQPTAEGGRVLDDPLGKFPHVHHVWATGCDGLERGGQVRQPSDPTRTGCPPADEEPGRRFRGDKRAYPPFPNSPPPPLGPESLGWPGRSPAPVRRRG